MGSSSSSSSSSPLDLTFALLSFSTSSSLSVFLPLTFIALSLLWFHPGGLAWAFTKARKAIPGPPGMVLALSGTTAHIDLAKLSFTLHATKLMAFSVGLTRFIISSSPDTAKEILNSSAFADRPIKESAYELLFHRAMGFAPFGEYWRNLRRISSTYLFSPKRISGFGEGRMEIGLEMVEEMKGLVDVEVLEVRKLLHFGSLNNVMMSVFGRRYKFGEGGEGEELEGMVKEGYELLGVFNWGDHFPGFAWLDLQGVRKRCGGLVARVIVFVGRIIEEHRQRRRRVPGESCVREGGDGGDFVDVLLDLQEEEEEEEEKLSDSDMVAVLWEMIFRGTDTVAILLEWILARMVLHPEIQSKAQSEIDSVVGRTRPVSDSDIPNLPYLQSIVKESLRMHPPGPLLSWARLAIHDVHVGSHFVPAGTTAMVNMWAIAHDEKIWARPNEFEPERFMKEDMSIMGSDLRLAPFGSGRRVCPGKAMGLATVHLWLALMLQNFKWEPKVGSKGVDLSECLKMSLEMKNPLVCRVVPRV